jgi:hypothetical protein
VRIEGESLGLANVGGIAFIEPVERPPEDEEIVLAVLHDQTDPDSRSRATLRIWRPERDLRGNRLAVRLWSEGSVEPLTVTHPDGLIVRGVVRRTLSAGDLHKLGYR